MAHVFLNDFCITECTGSSDLLYYRIFLSRNPVWPLNNDVHRTVITRFVYTTHAHTLTCILDPSSECFVPYVRTRSSFWYSKAISRAICYTHTDKYSSRDSYTLHKNKFTLALGFFLFRISSLIPFALLPFHCNIEYSPLLCIYNLFIYLYSRPYVHYRF